MIKMLPLHGWINKSIFRTHQLWDWFSAEGQGVGRCGCHRKQDRHFGSPLPPLYMFHFPWLNQATVASSKSVPHGNLRGLDIVRVAWEFHYSRLSLQMVWNRKNPTKWSKPTTLPIVHSGRRSLWRMWLFSKTFLFLESFDYFNINI